MVDLSTARIHTTPAGGQLRCAPRNHVRAGYDNALCAFFCVYIISELRSMRKAASSVPLGYPGRLCRGAPAFHLPFRRKQFVITLSQGSCGYGKLDKGQWPYWSVAALSSSNSFALKGPVTGCGCVATSYMISNEYYCVEIALGSDLQDVYEQLACSVCCAGSAPRSCTWVLPLMLEAFSLEDGVPLSSTDSLHNAVAGSALRSSAWIQPPLQGAA